MSKAVQYDMITGRPFEQARSQQEKVSLKEATKFLKESLKVGGYVEIGIARRLAGVCRQRMYQLRDQGELDFRHWQNRWFVTGDSLTEYIEKKRKKR